MPEIEVPGPNPTWDRQPAFVLQLLGDLHDRQAVQASKDAALAHVGGHLDGDILGGILHLEVRGPHRLPLLALVLRSYLRSYSVWSPLVTDKTCNQSKLINVHHADVKSSQFQKSLYRSSQFPSLWHGPVVLAVPAPPTVLA